MTIDIELDAEVAEEPFNRDNYFKAIEDLADVYGVRLAVIHNWITDGNCNLSEYDYCMFDGDILIHDDSWEQYCEDFWFRNV